MDAFYEYIGMNRDEGVMDHARAMVSTNIPGMMISQEYGREYYEAADRVAKKIPFVDSLHGNVFDNLKDLATYYADEFEKYLQSGKPLSDEESKQFEEDPDIYMAINFGVASR